MPITSNCFSNWCNILIERDDLTETDYRSIVSRSYYSAYHATLSFAEDTLKLRIGNIKGSTHLKLSETLADFICEDKDREKAIRRIGARIHALHSLRIRADYFLDDSLSENDARGLIKNTSALMSIIDSIEREIAA
jgi:uncharacterized protein (UPF0332 family)